MCENMPGASEHARLCPSAEPLGRTRDPANKMESDSGHILTGHDCGQGYPGWQMHSLQRESDTGENRAYNVRLLIGLLPGKPQQRLNRMTAQ